LAAPDRDIVMPVLIEVRDGTCACVGGPAFALTPGPDKPIVHEGVAGRIPIGDIELRVLVKRREKRRIVNLGPSRLRHRDKRRKKSHQNGRNGSRHHIALHVYPCAKRRVI
jgi:hypothetical protein